MNKVYVITRKKRGSRYAYPMCFQESQEDADQHIKMLREDEETASQFFYNVRVIEKGIIDVKL